MLSTTFKALKDRVPSNLTRKVALAYDKLVISVGSVSNTHGVPGLSNCSQLKTIGDVREIRSKIINNLESANLPTVGDEERRRLLSFVVCGGGPTGVEFASEVWLHTVLKSHYSKPPSQTEFEFRR